MSQLVIGAEHAVRAPGPSTAWHQIRAVAGIAPDAVAMRCGDRSTSYGELLSRARIVAASLDQLGGVRARTVGVCADRSPEFVAGCLGAWLAGASYLPLDPEHPTARRELLLRDAGAAALLTMPELAVATGVPVLAFDELGTHDTADGTADGTADEALTGPGDLAYVMYTSGSTGTPKGVAVSHAALADLIRWHHGAFGITAADRVSVVAGIGFDASAWEIWGALSAGASLHVPPERARLVPALLRDWLLAEAITVTWAPTVLTEQLIALPWPDSAALRVLLTGGDRLRRRPCAGLPFALVNSYGPTECTVVATYGVIEPGGEDLPDIGRPRPGLRTAVLDAGAVPVPDGEPGELYLGGTGVAREYLGRPALTAAAFAPDPDGPPGSRRYRTGDVVRRTADGLLHFIGRVDGQVKVRGNRIERGEVEAALLRNPGVAAAVVRPYAGPGGTQLVAYVVPAGAHVPTTAQLRRHLRMHLPEPFVPQVIMLLDALPLAPNSKVDLARLPEPDPLATLRGTPPRTPAERAMLEIWREVLRADLAEADAIGVDDAFDQVGGTSLSAARIAARIADRFGIQVPLRRFFSGLTVAELADRAGGARPGPVRVAEQAAPDTPAPDTPRPDTPTPASPAQRRLWLLDSLAPDHALYTNALLFDLRPDPGRDLDREALRGALAGLLRRHEALRTRIAAPGVSGPVQIVIPPYPVHVSETDLRVAPPQARRALLEAECGRPFDLASGHLIRASLLRVAEHEWQLLLAVHHLAIDGWSVGLLARELAALYAGTPLAEPLSYADCTRREAGQLSGQRLRRLTEYWAVHLAGQPAPVALPADRPRPTTPAFTGRTLVAELPDPLLRSAENLAREEEGTFFTAAMAALATLLYHWTGQRDVVIGVPAANRPDAASEDVIGCFVNVLPLRCDLSGQPTFRQLIGRLRDVVLGALEHQALPFEQILAISGDSRDRGARPLVRVMLAAQPPGRTARDGGLEISFAEEVHAGTARFELTFSLEQVRGRPVLALEYDTELFEPDTAEQLLSQFVHVLAAGVQNPEGRVTALPLMPEADRLRIAGLGRGEKRTIPEVTVPELVAAAAAARPGATAVRCGDGQLSYRELTGQVNALAWRLRDAGVSTADPVAVCFERSVQPVVALLAVLSAGGVYVPLDPAYPDERLREIVRGVQPAIVLTSTSLRDRLRPLAPGVPTLTAAAGQTRSAPPPRPRDADPPAYVIYTSGSTGQPKGVQVSSTALLNVTLEKIRRFHLGPDSRALQYVPLGFGVSITDICATLAAGGTLVIRGPEVLAGQDLARLLREARVSHLVVPASLLAGLPEAGLPDLRIVVAGGEPCPADLVARWAPGRRFVQAYGPTEAAVCTTTAECTPGPGLPPAGRPLANVDVLVLDRHGQPVPRGVVGEVHIGGAGLARGYLGQPGLTAEKFVPHPFAGELAPPGARVYRTGDLGRFQADGQVRVEITEVEAALRALPGVADAAVRVHHHPVAGQRLIGYAVLGAGAPSDPGELKAGLRRWLPDSMLPAEVVPLDTLPRTATGKLDRRALPDPPESVRTGEGPRSDAEHVVAQAWAELLRRHDIGIDDDFFTLGGDSLLGAQVAARLRERLDIDLPLRALFEAPTVARLAARIEQAVLADIQAELAAAEENSWT
ncbi:MAG: amino acid adenylation domain-containing protein [Streptosporangiaceae bacterium]